MINDIEQQLEKRAIENRPNTAEFEGTLQTSYTAEFDSAFDDEEKQSFAEHNFEINLTKLVNGSRDF